MRVGRVAQLPITAELCTVNVLTMRGSVKDKHAQHTQIKQNPGEKGIFAKLT